MVEKIFSCNRIEGENMAYKTGLDLSTWQRNFNLLEREKIGDRFVILRGGFSTTKDKEFENHYLKARGANLFIGAYQYTHATTEAEAIAEAESLVAWLSDKTVHLPIFLDIEENKVVALRNEQIEKIYLAWENVLQSHGYKTGIYANLNTWRTKLTTNLHKRAIKWVAKWSSSEPGMPWDIWQFTSTNGKLDKNFVHDYFLTAIMDGKYLR